MQKSPSSSILTTFNERYLPSGNDFTWIVERNFFSFPYHSSILVSFQVIYGKEPLKFLEAAVTC